VTVISPAYQPVPWLFRAVGEDGVVRVVLAPDSFGDLYADSVAEVLAAGWRDVAPDDDVITAPLSDGGYGFVPVLAAGLPGCRVERVEASGPTREPSGADVLVAGSTAYLESAAVCGLKQVRRLGADVRTTTTDGVGRLVRAAAAMVGVETVVVGLGGSGTNDGGAGLWAALGAEPADLLRGGGAGLRDITAVTVPSPDVRLVAATDVDNPLLGLHGASAVYGPQKGADRAAVMELDTCLERWADAVEAAVGRPGLRDEPGSGAAGGLGFGLLAVGAHLTSGVDIVIDVVGLREKVAAADLVVTGEGRYDATSLRGKVPSGVARVAQEAGVPCVVAAGQATIGAREAAAQGIDGIFTVTQITGSVEAALEAGQDGIRELGRAIAREWSR
jgi:glycerate kinase